VSPAALLAAGALALLQGERDTGISIDGLIQAVIVFVFFILPVLKSILEVRKRKAGERGAPRKPARGRRAEVEKAGRDLWRELLGGAEPEAPTRPAPPPVVASPRPPASSGPRRRPDRPSARKATMATPQLDALDEARRRAEREAAGLARAEARLREAPRRAAEQELGGLMPGVASSGVGRFESTLTGLAAEDPATLDDEIQVRWGGRGLAVAPAGAPAAGLGAGVDWRQAVLLSELLSPPLALREPGAAWPGPPSALAR
jgi:hypothetical protein